MAKDPSIPMNQAVSHPGERLNSIRLTPKEAVEVRQIVSEYVMKPIWDSVHAAEQLLDKLGEIYDVARARALRGDS